MVNRNIGSENEGDESSTAFDIALMCMPHHRIGYIIAISSDPEYISQAVVIRQGLDEIEWLNALSPWPDETKPHQSLPISQDCVAQILDLLGHLRIDFGTQAGEAGFGATSYQVSIEHRGLRLAAAWTSLSSIDQTGLPALCRAMQRMAGEDVH